MSATTPPPPPPSDADQVVAAYNSLADSDQRDAAVRMGLFDFDQGTRKLVWIGVLTLLGIAIIGALILIYASFQVNITTQTGTGANAVTATTHPDMAAAWAAVSAVIAGVVGILVPSPRSSS